MNLTLTAGQIKAGVTLTISGSKSETNRLLLLQALYPELSIANASSSDDAQAMRDALDSTDDVIDIHHAGTAMRFLTAYFAMQAGSNVVLTGSARMQQRPIKILVEALRSIGADITYTKNEGYPPLAIKGKPLNGSFVQLPANVSSQYITALSLIAPRLENGLEIELEGQITSIPYIEMTMALLRQVGVDAHFEGSRLSIAPLPSLAPQTVTVESDWSSASYPYSIVALSQLGTSIRLRHFRQDSLQGDHALVELYRAMGVETVFENDVIVLTNTGSPQQNVAFDLNRTPDIAQTIAVTCFGLGIGCELSGLHTLKIKETDRLVALRDELGKFGAAITVSDDALWLNPTSAIRPNISVKTYDDHRMAMAFAPLALKVPIAIENAEVVRKSYPDFWTDMETLGFVIDGRQ